MLTSKYCAEPGSILVEEFGLCEGSVRADLAVVNGVLKGFEIKSERDSLARLPRQVVTYNLIFDTVSLMAADRHLVNARKIIPDWWGIYLIERPRRADGRPKIKLVRREKPNPDVDAYAVAQLLWKEEATEILRLVSPSAKLARKAREAIWTELSESLPLIELKKATRDALKKRKSRQSVQAQEQCDETSLPASISSGCLSRIFDIRTLRYIHRPS